MVIFHSYVSLPEGTRKKSATFFTIKVTIDFGGEDALFGVYWAMSKSNHLGMGQKL